MKFKNLLIFLGGSAFGVLVGALATKKIVSKKYQKLLEEKDSVGEEEIEDYYKRSDSRKNDNYKLSEDSNTGRENGIIDKNERKNLKNDGENEEKSLDYTKFYKIKESEKDEEGENDEEEDPDEAFIREDYAKNKDREPRIVSYEKLEELVGYENLVLFYYVYDDIVTTEDGEVLEDIGYYLGNCLDVYGFADSDEAMIFVQNFNLRIVYEVQKVWAAYGDGD